MRRAGSSFVLYSYVLPLLVVWCGRPRPRLETARNSPTAASSGLWLQYTDVRQAGFDAQALEAVCERADSLRSVALMAVWAWRTGNQPMVSAFMSRRSPTIRPTLSGSQPANLARFGQLYLQEGRWAGKQIVPADWVRESTRPHTDDGDGTGYGYMWWTYQAGRTRITAAQLTARIIGVSWKASASVLDDYAGDYKLGPGETRLPSRVDRLRRMTDNGVQSSS